MTQPPRRPVVVAVLLLVMIPTGCRSADGGTAVTEATEVTEATAATEANAEPGAGPAVSQDQALGSSPEPADSTSSTSEVAMSVATSVLAASTTLADLLTEDEVAEVERALDELEVLLGEIDADLADVPDP